ncbi:MAG: GatB/YqeY domain-containing protein [Nitrospirae bacterium]|nr:GatB/YqeY domain-containing protein [Nitrospirota bacterium]
MSVSERIVADYKEALKAGDKNKVSVLRMIKSSMKYKEIDKKAPLTDEEVQAILMSSVKRAKESIEQFSKAGREDLVNKEKEEMLVVQDYLPKQLGEDELKKIVKDVITAEGASGPKDTGKVMKSAMARLKGQADGKLVSQMVKELLEA